ncbi:MAG: hypothetical protein AAGG48_14520 [Planctomycetota bacterium]
MYIKLWSFITLGKKEYQPGGIVEIKDEKLAKRILKGQGGFECDKDGEPIKRDSEGKLIEPEKEEEPAA